MSNDYITMTSEELLDSYLLNLEVRESADRAVWAIKAELRDRMTREGATELPIRKHTVRLRQTVRDDNQRLALVRELINPEDLEAAGAYTPEHTEVVPEKFNATRLKPFRKRGKDIADAIDRAKIVSDIRVTIEEK